MEDIQVDDVFYQGRGVCVSYEDGTMLKFIPILSSVPKDFDVRGLNTLTVFDLETKRVFHLNSKEAFSTEFEFKYLRPKKSFIMYMRSDWTQKRVAEYWKKAIEYLQNSENRENKLFAKARALLCHPEIRALLFDELANEEIQVKSG